MIFFDNLKYSFANWLIGKRKINYNFSQNISQIGDKGEIYIDTANTRGIYDNIPQARAVVDKDAVMFSNARIAVYDKSGKELTSGKEFDEVNKLFNNPNPVEKSLNQLLINTRKHYLIYGNSYTYKNQPTLLAPPVCIWNMSPAICKPVASGKMFQQTKESDIISKYIVTEGGKETNYKTGDIMCLRQSDLDNPIEGRSSFSGLKYPLSNTEAAYKYLNAISASKGNIGILSTSNKDSSGVLPVTPEMKKEIHDEYLRQNGLDDDQKKIMITEAAVTWQPMSYPTAQLLLLEQNDANFRSICDHFGHSVHMYGLGNTTFENVKNGIVQTYQDVTIPFGDLYGQSVTKFLGYDQKNVKIGLDYSHVPILQTVKKESYKSIETIVNMLKTAVETGILDKAVAINLLKKELGVV